MRKKHSASAYITHIVHTRFPTIQRRVASGPARSGLEPGTGPQTAAIPGLHARRAETRLGIDAEQRLLARPEEAVVTCERLAKRIDALEATLRSEVERLDEGRRWIGV